MVQFINIDSKKLNSFRILVFGKFPNQDVDPVFCRVILFYAEIEVDKFLERYVPLIVLQVIYNNNPQVVSYPNSAHLSSTTEYRNQYKAWSAGRPAAVSQSAAAASDKENLNVNNNNSEKPGEANLNNNSNKHVEVSKDKMEKVVKESVGISKTTPPITDAKQKVRDFNDNKKWLNNRKRYGKNEMSVL